MQKTLTISRRNVTLLLIYQLMAQATTSDIAHCDNTCPSNGKSHEECKSTGTSDGDDRSLLRNDERHITK